MHAKESKEALGHLPLVLGLPIMITENLSMENKIVNSSEGILIKLIYQLVPEGQEAVCAYVKVKLSPICVKGLSDSVAPIFSKPV